MNFKIIAVDFDGTLCENKWPEIGEPNEMLFSYLLNRQSKGDKIILWTCRTDSLLNDAIQMCKNKGLIFDAVNGNLPETIEKMGGDSRKIFADEYIDDRNYTVKLTKRVYNPVEKAYKTLTNVFFNEQSDENSYLVGIEEAIGYLGEALE